MNQAKQTTSDFHNPAQLISGQPLPIKYLQTLGATAGQVPTFNGTTVIWSTSAGLPSAPFNSIQYNDNGAFYGDSLAVRDPITNETSIGMPVYAEGNVNDNMSQEVVWRADNTGSIGNSITLVFNGVDDTNTVLAAWNMANPSNTASVIGGTGNFVPPAHTIDLAGGGEVAFIESLNLFEQGFQGIGEFYNSGGNVIGFNGLLNTGNSMQPFVIAADFVAGDIGLAQWEIGRVQLSAQRGSNGDNAQLKLDAYQDATLSFNGSINGQSAFIVGDGYASITNRNYNWTWPTADGSAGQSIVTDGAGNLSFAASGGLTGYTDANNTALGQTTGVTGLGFQNTFLGNKAGASLSAGDDNIFIGFQSMGVSTAVPANNAIVIGAQQNVYAWSGSDDFIAIGKNTISVAGIGAGSVIIGSGASSATADGVAIGFGATSGGVGSIAIGSGASSIGHSNSIAIGQQAINTTSNQFVVGSNAYVISDFYFGSGVRNGALPNNVNMNATGGVGTDASGGQFLFYGGQSTGTGVGGDIRFYVAPAVGMSGVSDNPYHNFLSLGANKISKFGDIDDAYYGLRLDIDNNAGGINLGNQGGAGGNSTNFQISDAAQTITSLTHGGAYINADFEIIFQNYAATKQIAFFDATNLSASIGDYGNQGNSTLLSVDDSTKTIINVGGIAYKQRNAGNSTPVTVAQGDYIVYAGSGSIGANFNLPAISSVLPGTTFVIKDTFNLVNVAGTFTIVPNGADTIDYAANYVMGTTGESVTVVSELSNTNWMII